MATTITTLTKDAIKSLSSQIEAALQQVAEANGVQIIMAGGTFTPNAATLKISVAVKDGDTALTHEVENFKKYAKDYDIQAELGDTFREGKHTYKIIGLTLSSKKAPVLTQREDGRRYRFPVYAVNTALGKESLISPNGPLELRKDLF